MHVDPAGQAIQRRRKCLDGCGNEERVGSGQAASGRFTYRSGTVLGQGLRGRINADPQCLRTALRHAVDKAAITGAKVQRDFLERPRQRAELGSAQPLAHPPVHDDDIIHAGGLEQGCAVRWAGQPRLPNRPRNAEASVSQVARRISSGSPGVNAPGGAWLSSPPPAR
ncbi:MAG: hypothetical protein C4289_15780, partial [Chloroflexota bacterium]